MRVLLVLFLGGPIEGWGTLTAPEKPFPSHFFSQVTDVPDLWRKIQQIPEDAKQEELDFLGRMLAIPQPWICSIDEKPRNLHLEAALRWRKLTPEARRAYQITKGAEAEGERKRLKDVFATSHHAIEEFAYANRGTEAGRAALLGTVLFHFNRADWTTAWLYSHILLGDWPLESLPAASLVPIELLMEWANDFRDSRRVAEQIRNLFKEKQILPVLGGRQSTPESLAQTKDLLRKWAPRQMLAEVLLPHLLESERSTQESVRNAFRFGIFANLWDELPPPDPAFKRLLERLKPAPDIYEVLSKFRGRLPCAAADLLGPRATGEPVQDAIDQFTQKFARVLYSSKKRSAALEELALSSISLPDMRTSPQAPAQELVQLIAQHHPEAVREAWLDSESGARLLLSDAFATIRLLTPEEKTRRQNDLWWGIKTANPLLTPHHLAVFNQNLEFFPELEKLVVAHALANKGLSRQALQGVSTPSLLKLIEEKRVSEAEVFDLPYRAVSHNPSGLIPALQKKLQSESSQERLVAVTRMGQIRNLEAFRHLRDRLSHEKVPEIRLLILRYLGLGPVEEAIAELKKLLVPNANKEEKEIAVSSLAGLAAKNPISLTPSQLDSIIENIPHERPSYDIAGVNLWSAAKGKNSGQLSDRLVAKIAKDERYAQNGLTLLHRLGTLSPQSAEAISRIALSPLRGEDTRIYAATLLLKHHPNKKKFAWQIAQRIRQTSFSDLRKELSFFHADLLRTSGVGYLVSEVLSKRLREEGEQWTELTGPQRSYYSHVVSNLATLPPVQSHLSWMEKVLKMAPLREEGHDQDSMILQDTALVVLRSWASQSMQAFQHLVSCLSLSDIRLKQTALGSFYHLKHLSNPPEYLPQMVGPLLKAVRAEPNKETLFVLTALDLLKDFPGTAKEIHPLASELAQMPPREETFRRATIAFATAPDASSRTEWFNRIVKLPGHSHEVIRFAAEAARDHGFSNEVVPFLENALDGGIPEQFAVISSLSILPPSQRMVEKILPLLASKNYRYFAGAIFVAYRSFPTSVHAQASQALLELPREPAHLGNAYFWSALESVSVASPQELELILTQIVQQTNGTQIHATASLGKIFQKHPEKVSSYLRALPAFTKVELKTYLKLIVYSPYSSFQSYPAEVLKLLE